MKPPLFLLFLFTLLFVLVGMITLSGELIALAAPFLVMAIMSIMTRPAPPQLRFQHEVSPKRARQDEPLKIEVTITNEGAPIPELVVSETIFEGMRVLEGTPKVLAYLPAGDSLTLEYTLQATRGRYNQFLTQLAVQQPLRGFEWRAMHSDAVPVLVYPQSETLSPIRIHPPQTHGFAGSIPSRRGGSGLDFLTIREYQPGDSLRKINWKVSQRGNQTLYTNIFEQEQVADVGIILDARQHVNLVAGHDSIFENSVSAAASLAELFIGDGHRVSLLVYGSGKQRVFPGYGRLQQRRMLDTISAVTPVLNFALTNFDNLPVRFFAPKSQIVLISPIVREDIPYIRKMVMRGYGVMLVSPNPIKFIAKARGDTDSLGYRFAIAERTFMLQQLRQIGVQVVDWETGESLNSTLQRALHTLQPTIRRGRILV